MDTCLEWKILVIQRRFTSGYRTVGGEAEGRNNHGRLKYFMRRRNMEEDMAEERYFWRLGIDRRLLAV